MQTSHEEAARQTCSCCVCACESSRVWVSVTEICWEKSLTPMWPHVGMFLSLIEVDFLRFVFLAVPKSVQLSSCGAWGKTEVVRGTFYPTLIWFPPQRLLGLSAAAATLKIQIKDEVQPTPFGCNMHDGNLFLAGSLNTSMKAERPKETFVTQKVIRY